MTERFGQNAEAGREGFEGVLRNLWDRKDSQTMGSS